MNVWVLQSGRPDFEQGLAEFHGFGVFHQNLCDHAFDFSFDFIHHFHCFDNAYDGFGTYIGSNLNVARGLRGWCAIKSANHW